MNLVNNSLLCGDIVFLCFYLFVLILSVPLSHSTLLRSSALYWLKFFCEHNHYFILLLLLLYYLLPCHGENKAYHNSNYGANRKWTNFYDTFSHCYTIPEWLWTDRRTNGRISLSRAFVTACGRVITTVEGNRESRERQVTNGAFAVALWRRIN